jgi:hypothetical protein
MTAPDLRTAVRAAIRDVERRVDTCPGCDTSKAHGVHGKDCSWKALRSALTAEATEPPADPGGFVAEILADYGDDLTNADDRVEAINRIASALTPGSAPNPQGADDRCRVSENGSVSHRWACDFGPDCPAPGGVMHDPQGAEAPTPPSPELERQRGYSAGWHAGFREGKAAATGGVPDEPGDDDFPTTAAVLDSLEDIEQFHDDADMQTAAGVARLALIGYRDRYAELLAEVERLRAAAQQHERQLGDEVDRRDAAEEWADKLAHAIAGPEIGEHSNANQPWVVALEVAESFGTPLADRLREGKAETSGSAPNPQGADEP